MRIYPSKQPDLPPPDKPLVLDPVLVAMDVPLFYMTERGPVPWQHKVYCGRAFAETVLRTMNELLGHGGLGMVHIGFYNPRKARRKDGTPIAPARWSNHAYGEAVDFKGVTRGADADSFLSTRRMKQSLRDELDALRSGCETAIVAAGRKPEIVDEGDWLHVGLWPPGR